MDPSGAGDNAARQGEKPCYGGRLGLTACCDREESISRTQRIGFSDVKGPVDAGINSPGGQAGAVNGTGMHGQTRLRRERQTRSQLKPLGGRRPLPSIRTGAGLWSLKLTLKHPRASRLRGLLDEMDHARIHRLHQGPGIQSNAQYEDGQWDERGQFPFR